MIASLLCRSSPRPRGGREVATRRASDYPRFIPACAGTLYESGDLARPLVVHPRACGAVAGNTETAWMLTGSSPCVRGRRILFRYHATRCRFIPVRVGGRGSATPRSSDHQQVDVAVGPRRGAGRRRGRSTSVRVGRVLDLQAGARIRAADRRPRSAGRVGRSARSGRRPRAGSRFGRRLQPGRGRPRDGSRGGRGPSTRESCSARTGAA